MTTVGRHFIGGQWRAGTGGTRFENRNPARMSAPVLGNYPRGGSLRKLIRRCKAAAREGVPDLAADKPYRAGSEMFLA